MKRTYLPEDIKIKYIELKSRIRKRLEYFSRVPQEKYFYELCFCLCTPQSKATNALQVQNKLEQMDFFNQGFDPTSLLRDPQNYIRFHNQKAKRLMKAIETYPAVLSVLNADADNKHKRFAIKQLVNGFGMKESSHFLRNIGYRNLAILDRHILKHLVLCGIYDKIPNVASHKNYLNVEQRFMEFSEDIEIPMDELDILFWSYETGEILK